MEKGTGEQWLITCTKTLRQYLPKGKYIVTHAPQAPYFVGKPFYPNGGYQTVDKEVGDLIDWYNIQFYNQGDTKYDTFKTLFEESDGFFKNTAVE
jgi:chitinase